MHCKQQNNTNHPSELLNPSQNAVVFSLLGKRCFTLATAVVQLVLADPTSLNTWSHQLTGVACFVKDNPKKSYFIKIYDCDKRTLKWQQEIYLGFEYRSPRPYFQTFEAHDCVVGLNFASANEAQIFKETIIGKLRDREKRRADHLRHNGNGTPNHQSAESKKNSNHAAAATAYENSNNAMPLADINSNHHRHRNNDRLHNNNQTVNNLSSRRQNGAGPHLADTNNRLPYTVSDWLMPTQSGVPASLPISSMQKSQSALLGGLNLSTLSRSAVKSEKKKLNKRDIGLPTNFQHVTHVGFSPKTGFDLDNVNPSMKKDLQKIFPEQQHQQESLQHQQYQSDQQNIHQFHMHQQQPHQVPAPPPPPVPPMPSPAVLSKSRAHSAGTSYPQSSPNMHSDTNVSNNVIQAPGPPPPPPPPPPRPLPPMPPQSNHSKTQSAIHMNNQLPGPPPPPTLPPPPMPGKALRNIKPIDSAHNRGHQPSSSDRVPNVAPPPPPPPPPPFPVSCQNWKNADSSPNGTSGNQQSLNTNVSNTIARNGTTAASPRDALMAEIRFGANKLKKVQPLTQNDQLKGQIARKNPSTGSAQGPPLNSRDSLLASIREAAGKPRQKARTPKSDEKVDQKNTGEPNLMSDLVNKLRARREGISGSFIENQTPGLLDPDSKIIKDSRATSETFQQTVLNKVSSMIPVRIPSPTEEDPEGTEFSDDDWN